MAAHVARRPEWLAALLSEKFFVPCETHSAEKKNERNVFCADCNVGICQHCASRCHVDHMLLQIRRYVYHDVIRLIDIQKLIDCALVQPYIINSAKVVFLNPRPLSRPAKASGNVNACASCERGLQDGYSFCCVACKVDTALKRGGLSKILQRTAAGPSNGGFRSSPPEFPQRDVKVEHPCEALARSRGLVGGLSASARRRRPRSGDPSVGASTVDRRRCNNADVEEKQRISPHSVFLHHDAVSAASSSSISASSITAAHRSRLPIPDLEPIHFDDKSRDSNMVSNPNRDSSMVIRHPRSPARPPAAVCRKSPISPARNRNSPTSPSMPAQNSPPSDDRSCRFLAQPAPLPDSPVLRLPKLASLPCLRIRLPSLSLTTKSPSPSPPTVRSSSSPPSFLAPHYLQKSYGATGAAGFFLQYDNDCETDDGDGNSVGTDEDEFAIPDSPAEQLNFISFRSISCADRLDFMSYRKRKRKNSPVRARFS